MLTMRPVKNSHHRKNSTRTSTKDNGLTRSIHRDFSRSFKNDEHLRENDDSMKLNKKLLCCSSCDDKRTTVLNSLDANLKTKYLKIYPNLWDVRVELVDLRYWWHGKVIQTLGTFPVQTIKVKKTDDSVTSSGYWLRQVKLTIPPALSPTRQVLQERKCRMPSLRCFHASFDCSAEKVMNMRTPTMGGCLETDFQIRDSRVVLSPLSSSQLKLLQKSQLQPKTLKDFSRNQKVSNRHYSEHVHKRKSTNSSSPARKRTSKTANCRKVLSNNKNGPGMKARRKQSQSVFGSSQKNKKRNSCKKNWKTRKHSNNTDMFEDPLYACLLSSSDSDYFQPVNLDDSQTRYTEKQSTPLSKYLDFRDESSDWVSPKSTPTRFHTKAELKRKVRVRRMRAEKLRKNRQKKVKKVPEMFPPSSDNDSVEELSAFEQLKRALGLMDKVQKKMCEDRYSEEEPYFGDSDD